MGNSEKAIELLKSLHKWFMESAPEQYNGCGLWIDVDAFLAKEGNRPVDRVVMPHNWGRNEGGYKLCVKCGTAKHSKPFEGFKYWFSGVGYHSDPGCRD